ncbi:low molecular weight protein-tyrosine-phosphatase [Cohaesibacter celericrescens]|uniref:protein-tyrosine-phosphatase n=1 Tax=Cohaesibacter celericrescens TaxID=2067669 RepID=A0A2N5XPP2_9HYPH|nr:low molecular weight protein-tyrosine-phosphatase [Cohaesibacter celericrescens]PLW76496.1 protein-tyrosine-phosphatase [Cohaesibacter celericrescens]
MKPVYPTSILFVCLGNICRSALAEGVMRHKVQQAGLDNRFLLDSCGTGAWHVGHPPDHRSIEVGRVHGVDLSDLSARKLCLDDFYAFDLILAMDRSNLADLRYLQPRDGTADLALYLDYCDLGPQLGFNEVPDPYYGGADGFEDIFQIIDRATDVLLQKYR